MNTEAAPQKNKIFDLVDVVEENPTGSAGRAVYELVDAVSETVLSPVAEIVSREDIMEQVTIIAEKTARELFPEIAERIIREEITKLKTEQNPAEK